MTILINYSEYNSKLSFCVVTGIKQGGRKPKWFSPLSYFKNECIVRYTLHCGVAAKDHMFMPPSTWMT